MKYRYYLLSILLFEIIVSTTNAQTMSRTVAKMFPAAVVAKIFEVATKVDLDEGKQVAIGRLFVKRDNLVAQAIVAGANAEQIQEMGRVAELELQKLLSLKEQNSYYLQKSKLEAPHEGKFVSIFLHEKMGADEQVESTLSKVYEQRTIDLYKAWIHYKNPYELERQMIPLIAYYDSLETKYERLAIGSAYLRKKMALLDSVKPLTEKQKETLTGMFLTKCNKSEDGYKEILQEVAPFVVSDTAYFASMFKADIQKKASINTLTYPARNGYPKDYALYVGSTLYKYNKEIVTADYSYPAASKEKLAALEAIHSKYRVAIDSVLTRRGIYYPNLLFSLAIRNSKQLELKQAQVDSLFAKSTQLIRQKTKFEQENLASEFDVKPFQRKTLPAILDEEQYYRLLKMQYQPVAQKVADEQWELITERNLAKDKSSSIDKKLIMLYYLNRYVTEEQYILSPAVKYAKLKKLDTIKPPILRRLEASVSPTAVSGGRNAYVW